MFMTAKPASKLLDGAYLYGDVGTGKTTAACGAIRAFVERHIVNYDGFEFYYGPRAKFVNVPRWFDELRDSYGNRSSASDWSFRAKAKVGLLVLDDIGKGKQTEWIVEKLYIMLNSRWEASLPTILTSNYGIGELASKMYADESMKDSIVSRIGGMCKPYLFDGPDLRVRKI